MNKKLTTCTYFSLTSIYLACISCAWANSYNFSSLALQPEEPKVLEEIVVTGAKIEQNISKSLAPVININLDKTNSANNSLVDVLRNQAGIEVKQLGGIGTQTSIFMRSANSSSANILLDGMPINELGSGTASLEHIDLSSIKKIEIMQSGASSLYGSGTTGSINLISHEKIKSNSYANAKIGSNKTYAFKVGTNQVINIDDTKNNGSNIKYGFNLNNLETDGINGINYAIYPQINPAKNNYKQSSFNAYISTKQDKHEFGLRVNKTYTDGSFDDPYGVSSDDNTYKAQLSSASLFMNSAWSTQLKTKFVAGIKQDNTKSYLNKIDNSRFNNTNKYISLQADYAFNPKHNISTQFEHLGQFLSSNVQYSNKSRNNNALRLAYNGIIDKHELQANMRYDAWGSQVKLTYYTGYGFNINDNWKVIASTSSGFSLPNFNQLYYPLYGNPNLKPERSRNNELSVQYKNSNILWRTNLYNTKYRDLIAYNDSFTLQNINRAKLTGVETIFKYISENLAFNANINYQQPHQYELKNNVEDKSLLLRRSRIYANLGLEYKLPDSKTKIGTNVKYTGSSKDIFYDSVNFDSKIIKLGGYAVADIYSSYQLNKELSASISLNNIFNRKNIYDVYGYNKPGREVIFNLGYLIK